jgi:rfaE bifunctional protein nucleotidyltransferase chain/domain
MGKLVSLEQCCAIRQQTYKQGKVAVLANGVFDLLHLGHVRYLDKARKLGDVLIVGLNSDRSVQLLKGPGRPLTSEAVRAEILCGLVSVDYVVVFDESTAERLVEVLRPDIYVKGGDYLQTSSAEPTALPEAQVVVRYGGRVEILPYVEGQSTTEMIERICQFSRHGEPCR